MATRSVDDVAAELYAVEPSAFVAARTDAVRAARGTGDRELAAAIGRLRRPSLAAWAVNQLARDDAAGLARLLALGEELREAQQQLRGEALQLLGRQRHELVATLTRRTQKLAGDAGHPLGAAAIQQVAETLGAAIADSDAARDVQNGRLVTSLSYAGFGPVVAEPPSSRPERDRPTRPAAPAVNELTHRRQREGLERELTEARSELDSLTRDAQRAAQALERADDAVADAQQELDSATQRRDAAARHAAAAERARHDVERRVQRLTEQLGGPG